MTYDNAIVVLLVAVSVLAFANYNQAKALRDNSKERAMLFEWLHNIVKHGKQTTEERRD